MKKIDVIVKYFFPVAAGIETNILETYSVLVKKGWDVTVHTTADEYLSRNSLPRAEVIRGIKVRRYPFSNELVGFSPDIDWNSNGLICLHNFNVFFMKFLLRALLSRFLFGKKPKIVLTPHGGFNPEWSIFKPITRIFKQIYHYTAGTLLINLVVDRVRAVSEWENSEITKKGVRGDKVVTISNGVENEAFLDIEKLASGQIKKVVSELGEYIIQIGRIYKIKNYETTIRALANTPKNLNYVIVGEPEKDLAYKNSLIELSQRLGVANRVKFLGVVRGVDKYYLLKHAKIMVHMAVWESFCNVVHEGLSQGLICIVANAYALPYLIKDKVNGYLVDTFDSRTLSNRINSVLSGFNTKALQEMRTRNYKYGRAESWDKVATKMDSLYQSLV